MDKVLEELEEELHPGFEQWAVCSLATVSDFDGGGDAPDVHWRYPANSLALLDELRAITRYDDVEYPLRIPLMSAKDRTNNQRSAYIIDENPFSGVFLLRFDQDEAEDRTYREGVGRTTARLVLEWMRKNQEQFAGLENEVNELTDTFYEVRGANFEVPTDEIERLLNAKQQYQSAMDRADDLRAKKDEIASALDQLDVALDARSLVRSDRLARVETVDSVAADERPAPDVMVTAFQRAQQVAGNITPRSARVDGIRDELTTLQDRRRHTFHDHVDGHTVQRTVFMAAVLAEIDSALETHRFDKLVDEFVEHNETTITEYDPSFDPTADPKDQFLETIEPMLDEKVQALSRELDELGITGRLTDRGTYTSIKEQLDHLRSTLSKLERALEERDRLAELADAIKEEYEAAHATLESQREALADAKQNTESELKTNSQRAEAAQRALERHKEAAQNSPLGRFVTLPVTEGAELQAEQFADDPGIAALVEEGIIDREAVVDRLRETLYDHEDGVIGASLETRGKSRSPSQGRPVVFCTQGTRNLVWSDAPSGTAPEAVANDEFAKQPETVFCTDDHAIGLLAVYGGLALDNFDHGYLRDSPFQGRATLWGEPIDLEDCYAYPELLPKDHPVSVYNRVETTPLPEGGESDD
ncbi:hypothetical protein [Halorientalis pallida]|uniref:Uncharacterized protein n=1 Tax=Halorientalis pallida TaxID=2479928 RepID=A0A498L277_9EURY|nr:hypothetical protein [Halorientalis pallida]RXK48707.1 hypothetical protein EAF64_13635 [Halorientalis pallida]